MADPPNAEPPDGALPAAPPGPAAPTGRTAGGDAPAVVGDAIAVLVFVLLGRTSHREGGAVAGFAETAWPFLTGGLLGWMAVLVARRGGRSLPGRSLPAGAVVLGGTVIGGMTLRRLFTGGGTPISFLLVATTFLALFLLGWRFAVRRVTGSRETGSRETGPRVTGPGGRR